MSISSRAKWATLTNRMPDRICSCFCNHSQNCCSYILAEVPPFPPQQPYTTCILENSSFANIRNILSNMHVQENSATVSETNRRTADWWQCWQLNALAHSSVQIIIIITIYKGFLFQITSRSCWWMVANLSQKIHCTVPVHFFTNQWLQLWWWYETLKFHLSNWM